MAKEIEEFNPVIPAPNESPYDQEGFEERLRSMIEEANNKSSPKAEATGFNSDGDLAEKMVTPAPMERDPKMSAEEPSPAPSDRELPEWENMSSHPSNQPTVARNTNRVIEEMTTLNEYLKRHELKRATPQMNLNSIGQPGTGNVQTKTAIYASSMGGVVTFSPVSVATFPQIVARMIALGFNWGYYYTPGMSITRSDSPWFLTISRHGFNDALSANPEAAARNSAAFAAGIQSRALDPLPSYYINSINQMKPSYFNFSAMAPCVSCAINLGEQRMSKIELFRGQSMDVPDGFAVGAPTIKLQMVDDEKGSLRKYLMNYQKKCYDLKTNAVASWRDVVFDIDILILRPGPEVDYHYTFYCILQDFDYQFQLERDGVGDMHLIDMPFSIVGAADNKDVIYGTSAPSFVDISGALSGRGNLTMKDISVYRTRDQFSV